MRRLRALLLPALVAAVAQAASAGELDDLGVSLHGFVLIDYAARATGKGPEGSRARDFAFGEERGRLELGIEPQAIDAAAMFKLDAFHDAIAGEADLEVREAYIDYRAGPLDLRLGRQVATWGVGDLVFVNDLFPKDYFSFFVGRPIEYLKIPSDGLRATLTSGIASADLVAIPFFTADRLPEPGRFVFGFDPFASVTTRKTEEPEASFRNTELAARLYRSILETDVALYAYRGFFHSPSFRPDDPLAPTALTSFFPPLSAYGASAQRNLLGGVLGLEGAYYDSRDDRSGRDPLVPNSSARWLAGFQRELFTDFTVGVQHVSDLMLEYDPYRESLPPGFPRAARYRQTLTFRVTELLLNQTLRLSAFAFYGITERDFLIIPEVEYKVFDRLSVALGGNAFGGAHGWTTFGEFRDDGNVYFWARFSF